MNKNDEKRAPVQKAGRVVGTVAWWEHEAAHGIYAAAVASAQSAERIAELGGFSAGEYELFIGHAPTTFEEANS